MKTGYVNPKLLAKRDQLILQVETLNRKLHGGATAEVAKYFHLGMVGGSGKPVQKLNRVRSQEIDRRIDGAVLAVNLQKELNYVEFQIRYQETAPLRAAIKDAAVEKLGSLFDTIEVGDQIDIGGNCPFTVIKKNRKTVVTESGSKWTAAEIFKVIKKS
jgi:hypothetical protein